MGTYVIRLRVADEDALYNTFDPERSQLSDEVLSYIEGDLELKHVTDDLELRVMPERPIDEARFRTAWAETIRYRIDQNRQERRKLRLKQLRLVLVGFGMLVFSYLLAEVSDAIIREALSIMGSVGLWEAFTIWIVESPDARLEGHRLESLLATKVVCDPVSTKAAP